MKTSTSKRSPLESDSCSASLTPIIDAAESWNDRHDLLAQIGAVEMENNLNKLHKTYRELHVGYKILIQTSRHNPPQPWRILGIQNGIALISEGWGVRKLVPMEEILSERFFVLESKAPWWLRFFILPNTTAHASAHE